ncbi:MAG: hypothetical protein H0X66_19525 [Verrucomicrobia bacterium]|nr:hypothetical protein [Verrucomicrobiota bacterium]
MSLDLNRLENVRRLGNGTVQARCPACAEGGSDRSGEHLRIYPDGRFGCCVHPKDREHRTRIFALVGVHKPGTFTARVKVASAKPSSQSVKAALIGFSAGTLGTPPTESESSRKLPSQTSQDFTNEEMYAQSKYIGTLGTGLSELRGYTREELPVDIEHIQEKLKDWELPVPSVPRCESASSTLIKPKLPFLTADGSLSIPFSSPERYHWWNDGQSVGETLKEVKERSKCADEY